MTLKDQLAADMKAALKSGDQLKLTVVRGLIATLNNKQIEKKTKTKTDELLSEEESIQALRSEAKKRKESITIFTQGGRVDLAKAEEKELAIIGSYLPTQLAEAEVEKIITGILAKIETREFGPAMKAVMAELKGKADAGVATKILKAHLGQ